MTVMFEHTLALTASQILEDSRLASWSGQTLELWLYEDQTARLALLSALADLGIAARVHSAYKPLLHFFLEDLDQTLYTHVAVRYPVVPGTDPKRFLLEAYPLARLLRACEVTWMPESHPLRRNTLQARPESVSLFEVPAYVVTLTDRQGKLSQHTVEAPNNWITDHLDERVLCPSGFLRVTDPQDGLVLLEQVISTEIELAYAQVMQWIRQHDWGHQEPYFERLEIRLEVPGAERYDAQGVLLTSTLEALHEDLYFSILEFFQQYSGRPKGDRGLQPGQIVPDIRQNKTTTKIQIILHPVGCPLPALATPPYTKTSNTFNVATPVMAESGVLINLAQGFRPLFQQEIDAALSSFDATVFEFASRQGRAVRGIVRTGSLPAIVLTGGQHANEPSGVLGALQAGSWLASQPASHFALVPLENPDGYQLYQEYRAVHPQHMHHAARYTGLGDDLEYREHAPWYETAARMHALDCTGARLHLSLHGYPAHEWTRPFTGYLPRGFELWSIPKGFFLIVRYQQACQQLARDWLALITPEIARIPGLAAFNAEQLEVYARHAGSVPFEVHHGIACLVIQNDHQTAGIKLVTEFPDETVYGEAFQFAQRVQTETVRIAATAWWQLNPASA